MGKHIVSILVGASFLAGVASADSLTELKGLENIGSGSSQHSPSQVVILNHTPNQSQDQNQQTESLNSSSQRYKARAGWGTGESLEAIRDSRINKEAKNEQVLMEKLEHSRMEDEKSRLRRLFKLREYNKRRHAEMGEEDYEFGSIEQDYETTSAPMQRVQRVVNVVHAPTVEVASVTPDVSKSSGKTSWMPSSNPYNGKQHYLKGQLGFGNYSASNATSPIGTASWGLSAGKHLNSRWLIEVGVYKTSYEVNDPGAARVNNFDIYGNFQGTSQVRSLDQYNFSGLVGFKAVKYNGILGTIRGGMSYVRRDSESLDLPGYQALRSNTIDGLIGLGMDVEVAENIMVTASFDYYSNLLNDLSSTNTQAVERIETANYSVLGLGLKFKF